ncbi:hypothetical protein TNCT_559821 [Trichonephila clavata]|uniref:Uncharacterized protein n=1 Tax=Trichonephila clavata TaxID=2740835 RepID=A0A8X6L5U6_TRICU|nr:hypothetical protein TNCT_559821 [Trichonephila clavata]
MFSHLSQPAWTEPKRNQQGRQTPELRKRGGREDVFVCSGPLLMKVDHNKQIKETIIEAFLRELRKSECFIGHFPPFEKVSGKVQNAALPHTSKYVMAIGFGTEGRSAT